MAERRLRALIESKYDARGTDQAARDMKNLGATGGQAAQGVGKMSKAAGGLLSSFGGLVAGGILLAAGRQVGQFGGGGVVGSGGGAAGQHGAGGVRGSGQQKQIRPAGNVSDGSGYVRAVGIFARRGCRYVGDPN